MIFFYNRYIYINNRIIPNIFQKFVYSCLVFLKSIFIHYDIIHIHGLSSSYWIPFYRLIRKKVIYTNHSNDFNYKSNYIKYYVAKFLKYCTYFANFTFSHDNKYKSKKHKQLNVIDTTHSIKLIKPNIVLPKEFFMYGGRFTQEKGAYRFLNMSKLFQDKLFFIVGSINLKEFVLPENVKYLGQFQHKEFLYILRSATALISPSYHESMDLTFMEAIKLNVKIIASRIDAHERFRSSNVLFSDFEDININEINSFITNKTIENDTPYLTNFNEISKEYIKIYENFYKR